MQAFALVSSAAMLISLAPPTAAEGGGWTVPELISQASDNTTYSTPDLTTGTHGVALLTWIQRVDDSPVVSDRRLRVLMSESISRGGWRVPSDLGPAASASEPSASVGGGGQAVVGYIGPGLNATVWISDPDSGRSTGETYHLDPDEGQVLGVEVASDDRGRVVAAWSRSRPNPVHAFVDFEVWVRAYSPDEGWGSVAKLAGSDDTNAGLLSLAMNGAGYATIVWGQWVFGGSSFDILAIRYDPVLGWGQPVSVASGNIRNVRMGMDSLGHAVLVWRQAVGDEHGIMGWRFVPGEGWGGPVIISPSGPGEGQYLRVAVNAPGQALALWDRGMELWSSRFTPETGWGAEERVAAFQGALGPPDIGVNSGGIGIAAWSYGRFRDRTIAAAQFVPDRGWENHAIIRIGARLVLGPKVAIDGQGKASLAWVQLLGEDHGVWSSRYPTVNGDSSLVPIFMIAGAGATGMGVTAVVYLRRRSRKKV